MYMPSAYVRIRRDWLLHNFELLRRAAAPAQVMPVLKGNAYGHGLEVVARWLEEAGTQSIGLATVAEARCLRAAGIRTPLFLLYGPEPHEVLSVLNLDIESAVWREDQVNALAQAVLSTGIPAGIHLLLEISHNWLGVPQQRLEAFCRLLKQVPGLELRGICAHVWNADDLEAQINRFEVYARQVQQLFPEARLLHIANSAALLHEKRSHFDIVRPGLALFGAGHPGLKQPMQIHALLQTVVDVQPGTIMGYTKQVLERPGRLGILGIGYSHGLDPHIVRGGMALVNGRRCPILSVGMGMTTIDLTHQQPEALPGTWATLLGSQAGQSITIEEIGGILSISPYEVLTRFCAALPRYY